MRALVPEVDYVDYDVGRLDRMLDEAVGRNWTVVDMARDWKSIFPASPRPGPRP